MLWSFASDIPLPPSFVAAPVVVRHAAMRPEASQWPIGANPATYSPIVSIRTTPSLVCCAGSRNGSMCFATCTTPPPLTPATNVTPHERRMSMSAEFPLSDQVPACSRVLCSRIAAKSVPLPEQKRPPFREASLFVFVAVVCPLSSRPHVRPRNKNEAEKNEDGGHETHVRRSETVALTIGQGLRGSLCRPHHEAICASARRPRIASCNPRRISGSSRFAPVSFAMRRNRCRTVFRWTKRLRATAFTLPPLRRYASSVSKRSS